MSILNLLLYPDKNLRKKALNVYKIDKRIINIIEDMFDTMYHYNGIGLSATQINFNRKIIIIDIYNDKKKSLVLINPNIVFKSKKKIINSIEGCLSIPNFFYPINRYKTIIINYLNIKGEKKKNIFNGLFSICIQHEIDHLNGILFIDYIKKNSLKNLC